jgi:hypothetical protein
MAAINWILLFGTLSRVVAEPTTVIPLPTSVMNFVSLPTPDYTYVLVSSETSSDTLGTHSSLKGLCNLDAEGRVVIIRLLLDTRRASVPDVLSKMRALRKDWRHGGKVIVFVMYYQGGHPFAFN